MTKFSFSPIDLLPLSFLFVLVSPLSSWRLSCPVRFESEAVQSGGRLRGEWWSLPAGFLWVTEWPTNFSWGPSKTRDLAGVPLRPFRSPESDPLSCAVWLMMHAFWGQSEQGNWRSLHSVGDLSPLALSTPTDPPTVSGDPSSELL